jgi:hypothetical protein
MSHLESIRLLQFESDFGHYPKVTKVTSSHDFRVLTPGPVCSRLAALQ